MNKYLVIAVGGAELQIDAQQAESVRENLLKGKKDQVIDGSFVTVRELLTPIEAHNREQRLKGYVKCEHNAWHHKNQGCDCLTKDTISQNTSIANENEDAYIKHRKDILSLSLDLRSKRTYFFDYVYKLMTGSEPSLQDRLRAEEANYTFYEKNPNRIYPDPLIYKDIIGEKGKGLSHFKDAQLGILENVVRMDRAYA